MWCEKDLTDPTGGRRNTLIGAVTVQWQREIAPNFQQQFVDAVVKWKALKMPNIIKEKFVKSKEKLREKARNFKPKEVISKLRDKGRTGSRRLSWLLLGIFLYFYFEWWA